MLLFFFKPFSLTLYLLTISVLLFVVGICMFQDCDIWFRNSRVARLIREIDFARYHYYHRTGIYQRSRKLKIRSLQGCTFTICKESVPLFTIYKIITKVNVNILIQTIFKCRQSYNDFLHVAIAYVQVLLAANAVSLTITIFTIFI